MSGPSPVPGARGCTLSRWPCAARLPPHPLGPSTGMRTWGSDMVSLLAFPPLPFWLKKGVSPVLGETRLRPALCRLRALTLPGTKAGTQYPRRSARPLCAGHSSTVTMPDAERLNDAASRPPLSPRCLRGQPDTCFQSPPSPFETTIPFRIFPKTKLFPLKQRQGHACTLVCAVYAVRVRSKENRRAHLLCRTWPSCARRGRPRS